MHTLRPNGRRRFTHFPHLGRPPCRSGNSQPAKNTSPPFYVRSAVFLTPPLKPAPPFYAFSASKNSPKKEKRRGISATDTPLSPTPRSLQCSLPHSPRFYTHFTPKSTPFHQQNPPRQNPHFIDAILYLFHQSQYLTLPLAIFFKYSPYLLLPYCLIISFNCAFVIHLLL